MVEIKHEIGWAGLIYNRADYAIIYSNYISTYFFGSVECFSRFLSFPFPHELQSLLRLLSTTAKMTRGNQRDKAREKNLKKKDSEKKKQEGDPKKRMEAHADIMRQKQKAGKSGINVVLQEDLTGFFPALEKKAADQ